MAEEVPSQRYYTPSEVALHNHLDDLWVSYLGKVYNLTKLSLQNRGDPLMKPILEAAGTDVSHWFNPKTKDIKTQVDPVTGCIVYCTPQGRFLHVPPNRPSTSWANDFGRPWWKDERYSIGTLSKKTRNIKVINTLTSTDQIIEVCTEETMKEILNRYLRYNAHADSYTWKYECVNLSMDSTLTENGIRDDDMDFYNLRINDDIFLQAIHLYFNDDLTVC